MSWFLGGRIICDRKGVFSLQLGMTQIQKRYVHVFILLLFFFYKDDLFMYSHNIFVLIRIL